MGRWSEFRVVRVDHSVSMAICGEAMERSGEVGLPWEGSRVGVSRLRSWRSLSIRESNKELPLSAARASLVWENHAGL